MSCEIVTSPITPLFAVDIVNNISLDFAGKVYLDKIYPIAYIGAIIKGETTHTFSESLFKRWQDRLYRCYAER
jgi:hypothetical protein